MGTHKSTPINLQRCTERVREIIGTLPKQYTSSRVVGPCKKAHLVDARQYIAHILVKEGFSVNVIGKVMERDHTSILHLLRREYAFDFFKKKHEETHEA